MNVKKFICRPNKRTFVSLCIGLHTQNTTPLIADIVRLLIQKNFRFCAFSLPHQNFELFIEWPNTAPNSELAFEFAPFNVKQHPKIRLSAHEVIHAHTPANELATVLKKIEQLPTQPIIKAVGNRYTETQEAYLQSLQKAIEAMPENQVDKFIYSRIESTPRKKVNVWDLLQKLNSKYPQTLTYYFQHPQAGCWLGATPEILGNWQGSTFNTMALAGTMASFAEVSQWGKKEQEEHAYVSKYIQKTFENHNIPQKTEATEVVKAGPVYHLRTNISSEEAITYNQAKELISALHPTPAICGVPLQKAQEFIENTEQHDRAYYTGYLGIVETNKRTQLFVNLRCMQILPNCVDLYLGGGITQKSNALAEWNETNHKANTLLNVLNAQ